MGLENPREKRVKRAKTQVLVEPSQGGPPGLHKRRKRRAEDWGMTWWKQVLC